MKNNGRKLIAAVTMLVVLSVMVVTVSYAWLTISDAPEARGIQISLGGGKGILIAPDQTRIENDTIYHYPGMFASSVNFNQHEQYAYLNAAAGLSPVSTADGLHWYLPTYYHANDEAVIAGDALAGQVKPISEFRLDATLSYANLTDVKAAKQGSYVYLDFWVVSPAADYDLRVARGDDDEGSFVIEMMTPSDEENGNGDVDFVAANGSVAASARVGFLVDHNKILDDTMLYYTASGNRPSEYSSLRGSYQELGEYIRYSSAYRFTIYEPNGDLHPHGTNGTYTVTNPIAWDGGDAVLADISDRLTVQLTNRWRDGEYADVYRRYLNGQDFSNGVDRGAFIASTSELYDRMSLGTVSQESLSTMERSGATIDTYVAHLEKNIPQRIRMFVWIEGQDSDCIGVEGDALFALGIELAGSQVSTNGKTKQEDS